MSFLGFTSTRLVICKRFQTEQVEKLLHGYNFRFKLGMGMNTENGIRIFGITIRIYSNIRFGRSCIFGYWYTVHDQFEEGKVRSGVSLNYLELDFLNAVRRDVNIKVSTVSWKPKAVVIKRFVVRHKSGNFCSQFLLNRQQNFRLRSRDKLNHYTDDLFKMTLQDNLIAECRYPLTIVQCLSRSDTKYCHGLNFGTKNLMCYRNQGFDRQ